MAKERSYLQRVSDLSEGKLRVLCSNWIINDLSKDFGIDFEARICEDTSDIKKQTVGSLSFYIQLKSDTHKCNGKYFEDLSTDDIILFSNQTIPVVLIKYYEKCDLFLYEIMQTYVWDVLNQTAPTWKNQKSKRIILKNRLVDLNLLKEELIVASKRIAREQTYNLSPGEGINFSDYQKYGDKNLLEYKHTSIELAFNDLKLGKQETAKDKFKIICDLPNTDEYKLNAILNLIIQLDPMNSDDHEAIIELSDRGEKSATEINANDLKNLFIIIKFQVHFIKSITRLTHLLSFNKLSSSKTGNLLIPFSQGDIQAQLIIHHNIINRINESLIELVKGRCKTEYTLGLLFTIEAITYRINLFGIINKEFIKNEEQIGSSILNEFIHLLDDLNNDDLLHFCYCTLGQYYYRVFKPEEAKNYIEKAILIAEKTGFTIYVKDYKNLYNQIKDHPNPYDGLTTVPFENVYLSDLKSIYKKRLEGFGHNLNNPDNFTKNYIIPALDDIDPSLILKCCRYLKIHYLTMDSIGRETGLFSIGLKVMWCKHSNGIIDDDNFENMFKSYKSKYCFNCIYQDKRNDEWTCTVKDLKDITNDVEFINYLSKKGYKYYI